MVRFVELFVTFNPVDIAIIKSLLDAEDIPYMLEGENFLEIHPIVQPARFKVDASRFEDAKALLKDYNPGKFGYTSG